MTGEPYSERVRELFARPDHAGDLENPDARVHIDDQGVRIALTVRCDGDAIERLRFRAWGCPHVLAAAESFCREFEGRPVVALRTFSVADILRSLSVPREKLGRILVIEEAVRSLGQSVRTGSKSGRGTD
jgi:NifU-like protein involved in Fe-S cluster formation